MASALTGEGIDELREAVIRRPWLPEAQQELQADLSPVCDRSNYCTEAVRMLGEASVRGYGKSAA